MKKLLLLLLLMVGAAFAAGHTVTLNWAWSQGTGDPATGFNVKRATVSGGPYTTVGTVNSPTTLTYTDSSALVDGTTYFYVITAFNTGGESTPSNEASAKIPVSAPVSPSGLTTVVN